MHFKSLLAAASVATAATIPNGNGFPMPNDQQKMEIAKTAGGLLPNTPLPKSLGAGSKTAFQLITANELFETAYFSSLLQNITNGAPGYEAENKDELIKIFTMILAQEEQHAIAGTTALETAGETAPKACEYMFPATDLKSSVVIAETFTALVLGALQGANVLFSEDGLTGPIQIISSVIGQEGEQNGYYRVFMKETPSESPFLTTVQAPFAWSALQMFIKPDSCPFPLSDINLAIFPPVMTNGGPIAAIEPKDQELSFEADLGSMPAAKDYINTDAGDLSLTYMTGQQLPITVPLKNVMWCGTKILFKADFPFEKNVMRGFSHAAITKGSGFNDSMAVVDATLAAPAIIQVSDSLYG